MNIVIVEDNEDIAKLYAAMLRREGHTLKLVSDGFAGWTKPDLWELVEPDAVILDLHLGEVSGLDVLKVLNALDPKPIVIIASASLTLDPAITALADVVLRKPFFADALRAALKGEA